ncbi:hypothetical protein Q7C36_014793 [Tachysurus vachellii]|uniref:Uncharacterized protein n=1 Tax=Tachysurus vachellii TaxID=175792 RepID=A0AA88MAA2_TACVA|nr:hypothetical protein Q7C36_014793 [Tachysurus vachellii]
MASDEAVMLTCHATTSALPLQGCAGNGRPSHTPVLHLSAAPAGEAPVPSPALLTSSSSHDGFFPSAASPVHKICLRARSAERQKKMENFENFSPRRPLKLATINIELPLELDLELSSHGKAHLLTVNQITVGQKLVKIKLDHQIHFSTDISQSNQNITSIQSACGLVSIGQSEGHKSVRSKLRWDRQPDEDQSKSAEGLKDDEGKPAASGAAPRQQGIEKVLEKPSSGNLVGKVWEAAVERESRTMDVYSIQEAAF